MVPHSGVGTFGFVIIATPTMGLMGDFQGHTILKVQIGTPKVRQAIRPFVEQQADTITK